MTVQARMASGPLRLDLAESLSHAQSQRRPTTPTNDGSILRTRDGWGTGAAGERRIVTGASVCAWVARGLGIDLGGSVGIGVAIDGEIAAGVVFSNYHPHMIEASILARRPDWCTRGVLRALFWYPFCQLGVRRLQALTARRNRKARRFLDRLGFKYEGMARAAWHGGGDAAVYSMLARECRWLDVNTRPPAKDG